MKRALLAALAALLASAVPATRALADGGGVPRFGAVELGVGQYYPNVDSEFTPPGAYQKIFGTQRGYLFRAGFAWTMYDRWGTLDLGLRTGYYRDSGHALLPDGTPSGDKTSFNVIPTSPFVNYRLDKWASWFPLVPYGRLTLERYNWWITGTTSNWAKYGATNGWSMTGGAALMLDFFDPVLGRDLRKDTGIEHTWLFFDFTKSKVDDFGSSKSWDLSDKKVSWSTGLMFTF